MTDYDIFGEEVVISYPFRLEIHLHSTQNYRIVEYFLSYGDSIFVML